MERYLTLSDIHDFVQQVARYESDFFEDAIRTAPKRQSQHTIKLQPQSSLYTLEQVMYANMYRRK